MSLTPRLGILRFLFSEVNMIINPKSWIWKLHKMLDTNTYSTIRRGESMNSCQYRFCSMLLLFPIAIFSIWAWAMSLYLFHMVGGIITSMFGIYFQYINYEYTLIFLAVTAGLVLCIGVLIWWANGFPIIPDYLKPHIKKLSSVTPRIQKLLNIQPTTPPSEPPPPGFIKQWWIEHKNKYCTQVTLLDQPSQK